MKSRNIDMEVEWYHLMPLMFILAVVPLIVYLKVIPLSGASYDFWNGARENVDFFSYYKGIWLLLATLTTTGVFLYKFCQSKFTLVKKDLNLYFIAIGIYMFFTISSTLFSEYPEMARGGFPDRYEGVFILIAYMLILIFTSSLISKEKHVKLMVGALISGALLIGLIGLFQYLGYDLWKSSFGKSLIIPSNYKQIADELQFQFAKNTIYASFYHIDYVGSYMAMLFPFSISLFILTKNKWFKIFMGIMTVLMAINWLGSNSRAGMVGGALALLVFAISINKVILKYWKYSVAALIVSMMIFFGLNQMSNGYLGTRAFSVLTDAKSIVSLDANTESETESILLRDITTNGNNASVTTVTEKLSFSYINQQLTFKNNEKNPIDSVYNTTNGNIQLSDPSYKEYILAAGKMDNKMVLKVDKGDIKLIFDLREDGIFLIDNKGNMVDLKPVDSWGFEGNERVGSSRGYIWSRSIPLLKNTLFLGFGPDTFAAYFPQNDIMGKMYAYHGDMWQVVDKPHNLYLQIALNTGVISLLGVLMLFGLYIIKSIRLYVKSNYNDFLSQVGVSIFVAIIGYLGAAFFNDSVVSVAPVFWILLGMGVSINHMISNRKGSNESISKGRVG